MRCLVPYLFVFCVFVCSCAQRPVGFPGYEDLIHKGISDSLQTGDSIRKVQYAEYFDILQSGEGIAVSSPYGAHQDTLFISRPLRRIVCLSSSHVACLAALRADSLICAVSGLKYLNHPSLLGRAGLPENDPSRLWDVGYDASTDYERLMLLDPDVVVAYVVGNTEPPCLSKIRSLGIPVLVLYDHMESHPLARAEYVKLFGVLAGRLNKASSYFSQVRRTYESLASQDDKRTARKVLLNIPYGDVWYVPGPQNYMTRLIEDAGGEVLGAVSSGYGTESSVMSVEQAYNLSHEADLWLCPGSCMSRDELLDVHHLFPRFGIISKGLPVYNNTLRMTPQGGNDFYESGVVRPDLLLQDLRFILSSEDTVSSLSYFLPLE